MTEKRFILDDDFDWWGIIDTTGRIKENEYNERISGQIVVDLLNKLSEENERLKQKLAIYRKIASCSNCEHHNYDWYSDGDEFEVCDKGNNVTDRICKDWEEL